MSRYISENIKKDLTKKAIILSGPRQVGKTTLAKALNNSYEYFNYDVLKDRKIIMTQGWKKDTEVVILDEIHKLRKWKNYLKGIIDEYQNSPALIVTGSARLEVFRKAGDALTGRTFSYRLHPIDLLEAKLLKPELSTEELFERILNHGGFPESFFSPEDSIRLLNDRLSTVLREDLRDLSLVSNLRSIELLVELLRERVGSQISYTNLANDLFVSSPTVKAWIELLEKLYLIFVIHPYSKGLAKSIRKEPKIFFYDCSACLNGEGAKLENLVVLALIKWRDFEYDTKGRNLSISYYRDSSHREVDFVITENSKVIACIEVKTSDDQASSSLKYLTEKLKPIQSLQLVKNISRETDQGKIKIRSLRDWLLKIDL